MNGLESAIRAAIDRAGAQDAEARSRVYERVRVSLERALAERGDLDERTIEAQRSRFVRAVETIEGEKTADEPAVQDEAPRSDEQASEEATQPEADAPANPAVSDTPDTTHRELHSAPVDERAPSETDAEPETDEPDRASEPVPSVDLRSEDGAVGSVPPVAGDDRAPAHGEAPALGSPEEERSDTGEGADVFSGLAADRRADEGSEASKRKTTSRRTVLFRRGRDAREEGRGERDAGPAEMAAAATPIEPDRRDTAKTAPATGRRGRRKQRKAERDATAQGDAPIFGRSALRWLSNSFLLVSLLVFVLFGLWLVGQIGLLDEPNRGPGPGTFAKFDSAGNGVPDDLFTEGGFVGAWKPILAPGDDAVKGSAEPGPDASIRPVSAERGAALRLISKNPDESGDIRIRIPAETLSFMAGRVTTVALNLRGVSGKGAEVAIECDFGALGDCSRRRFTIDPEMTDVVFDVDLTGKSAAQAAGSLLINTDIGGNPSPVDLFAAGVRDSRAQ
ncbi:hypothetical protein [Pararhizobium mangrovi]|uniref:Uncharacterized protein n=1 Tax=Pararhizobium mangrovi TaxID=2590452 RepID=A0A506TXB9_9HYPH|nr:hypothetical protein [Pararhizobium mangrovi]TPW25956.1 hypothetical protein FJU11_16935 [Pararhizobium mangrovi]